MQDKPITIDQFVASTNDLKEKFRTVSYLLMKEMGSGKRLQLYPCGCHAIANSRKEVLNNYCKDHGSPADIERTHELSGFPLIYTPD